MRRRTRDQVVSLYQLVSVWIYENVVLVLHLTIVQRARTDEQIDEYLSADDVCNQCLLLVVDAGVGHQMLDDVVQMLFEERDPYPEIASVGGWCSKR